MKEIRFIKSNYTELFRVPDGGKVKLTLYDGKELIKQCKINDEYHFELCNIGKEHGEVYHIFQFAEVMEQNGNKYEPVIEHTYRLETPTQIEAEITDLYVGELGKRCASWQSGCFDSCGGICLDFKDAKQPKAESEEFQREYAEVLNYLRTSKDEPLLRDITGMKEICGNGSGLSISDKYNKEYNYYLFKVQSEENTYLIRCGIVINGCGNDRDYKFLIRAYDRQELQKCADIEYVNQNSECISNDKFYKTENGFREVYYNPDANAGGQLVRIDFDAETVKQAFKSSKNMDEFFSNLEGLGRGYLIDVGTPEFKESFDEFKNIKSDFGENSITIFQGLMKAAGIKAPTQNKNVDINMKPDMEIDMEMQ